MEPTPLQSRKPNEYYCTSVIIGSGEESTLLKATPQVFQHQQSFQTMNLAGILALLKELDRIHSAGKNAMRQQNASHLHFVLTHSDAASAMHYFLELSPRALGV